MLKSNMKSLLGLLNQLMSSSNQQEQFQKIKNQLEEDEEIVSPEKLKSRVRIFLNKRY